MSYSFNCFIKTAIFDHTNNLNVEGIGIILFLYVKLFVKGYFSDLRSGSRTPMRKFPGWRWRYRIYVAQILRWRFAL